MKKYLSLFACLMLVCVLQAANAAVLVGWAEMPMHTYAEGPTEGQFNGGAAVATDKQIIQGFSAVLQADQSDQFYLGGADEDLELLARLRLAYIFGQALRAQRALHGLFVG